MRDTFYCQYPEYSAVYNMSSGFDSEIADDIPDDLAGQLIQEVTLWVGEWSGSWQDPVGVEVNFYHNACPPDMLPFQSFMIPWNQWETQLVYSGFATVYEATATLPSAVVIEAGMSMGGSVVITWGQDEPFAGLCATPQFVVAGCAEAYFDASWWGYTRWTIMSQFVEDPRDLAYCLGNTSTVSAGLSCQPSTGTLPFNVLFDVTLTNQYLGFPRTIAGRISITLAGGTTYPNWRSGYTNLAPGQSYVTAWAQNIPAAGSLIGNNLFQLAAQDITASPYNQAPYPPSGDTDMASCTVTGIAP